MNSRLWTLDKRLQILFFLDRYFECTIIAPTSQLLKLICSLYFVVWPIRTQWISGQEVLAPPFGFQKISLSVQLGNLYSDRYKRCRMVQYFITQFPSQLESCPRPLRNLENVWHQCLPSSRYINCLPPLRWWRRQSHPHSWWHVSLISI